MTSKEIVANIFKVFEKNIFSYVTFIVIVAAYYMWTWSPILAETGGDNAKYLMTANLYSPYSISSAVAVYFASNSFYPPMYPFLLGVLGGGDSILIAHIITTSFLLVALLVLYQWMLFLKIGKLHALLLVFIFSILPGTYLHALSIHSENIYLLFSLLGLSAVTCKENTGNEKSLWLAAIFIACASLSRSVGIMLVLAFIIYLFINKLDRKYLLSFVVLLPTTLWSLFNNQSGTSYFAEFSSHYTTGFFKLFLQQIINQSVSLLDAWYAIFSSGDFGRGFLTFFIVVCLLGVFYRLCKKKLDGVYVFLYLGTILIWPYPDELKRLLFPIMPILIIQTSLFIKSVADDENTVKYFQIGHFILLGTLLCVLIPNLILTVHRFNLSVDENMLPFKRTLDWYKPDLADALHTSRFNKEIMSSLNDAKKYIPEGQCVYSIKPALTGIYMERISLAPPVSDVADDEFYKSINSKKCKYFYFVNGITPSYSESYYPYSRLEGSLTIMKIYNFGENQQYTVSMLGRLKD